MKINDKYLQRLGVLPYENTNNSRHIRQLRGQWTMEPEEDLQTMHGIDAEEEMIRAMIEEVQTQQIRQQLALGVEDTIPAPFPPAPGFNHAGTVEPNTNDTSAEDTWSRLRAIVDSWIDRT